jgi:DnaJ-class molecular chaperone
MNNNLPPGCTDKMIDDHFGGPEDCEPCEGTGKVDCPVCLDLLALYCGECDGEGKVECDECEGEGYV